MVKRFPVNTLESEGRVSWPCAVTVLLRWDPASIPRKQSALASTSDTDLERRSLDGS